MDKHHDKRSFRHIGVGIPSSSGLKATVEALLASGAVLVRKNEEENKFFLKLNEGDVVELELYLSGDNSLTGVHFDKSVEKLELEPFASESLNSGTLSDSSVADMFFAPVVAYKDQVMEIEMAFYVEAFDWLPWLPRIEKTAAENSVLTIDIPEEEWDRLDAEKWNSLKMRLSKDAAERLFPYKDKDSGRFELTVVRYCGGCQHC